MDQQDLIRAASNLPRFAQLESVKFHASVPLVSDRLFEIIGDHLPQLKTLVFELWRLQKNPDAPPVPREENWQQSMMLSFAPLAKCKQLSTFIFATVLDGTVFSKQQILDLLSCESLTNLNTGSSFFGSERFSGLNTNRSLAWMVESPKLPSLQLRRINLSQVSVTPELWGRLCQLPTLVSLIPDKWPALFGEQWSKLAMFPNLQELKYKVDNTEIVQPCPHFWKALLRMRSITSLELHQIVLTAAELSELFQNLPQLKTFSLTRSRFESCSVFSESKIEDLTFKDCFNMDQTEFLFHECLPTIPTLMRLEVAVYRLGSNFKYWKFGEEALAEVLGGWKQALIQRMPYLTASSINYQEAYKMWRP